MTVAPSLENPSAIIVKEDKEEASNLELSTSGSSFFDEVKEKTLSFTHQLLLTVALGFFIIPYTYVFSAVGYDINGDPMGISFARWAKSHSDNVQYCVYGGLIGIIITFFFGAEKWKSLPLVILRSIILIGMGLCMIIGILLSVNQYSYGILCLFLVLLPIYAMGVYLVFNFLPCLPPEESYTAFLGGCVWPFTIMSAGMLVWFILWIMLSENNDWDDITKNNYMQMLGCKVPTTTTNTNDDDVDECLEAFVIWVFPMAQSLVLAFYAYMCGFLGGHHPLSKKFFMIFMFLLFVMWCAASLGGAGNGLSSAFFAFTMAGIFSMVVVGFLIYGWRGFRHELTENKMMKDLKEKCLAYENALQGLFVVTMFPLFILYLGVSAVRQFIRVRIKKFFNDKEKEETFNSWLTPRGLNMYNYMRTWNWTLVLKYGLAWGMVFMIMNVIISKFTVLLLSVLISACASMSVAVVTIILVIVGIFLFLLPPVPGVPIYITAGLLLIPVGKNAGWSTAFSIVYAGCLGLILKLLACSIQQKGIGEPLGNKVWVRKAIGINSDMIRVTRLVLADKGLSIAKISLLVGGPDWPTSVLCGVLKLNLFSILLGTMPVWALIWPTVLSGSFMYLSSPDISGDKAGIYGTLAAIFVTVAAIVQTGSLMVAAVYLDKEMKARKDQIDSIPIDEEVRVEEEKEKKREEAYLHLTHWRYVPIPWKIFLIFAEICMIISCYLVQLYPQYTFTTYALTDTIDDKLGGNWLNLMLPLGQAAVLFFLVGSICFYIFNWCWADKQVPANLDEISETLPSTLELKRISKDLGLKDLSEKDPKAPSVV